MKHRRTGACFLLLGAALFWTVPAWGAGGYGPAAPTGPVGAPGGYTAVVTAQTVPVDGGTVSGQVAGGRAVIVVRPHTFDAAVIVKLTAPSLPLLQAGLGGAGLSDWTAVAGLGIVVLHPDGTVISGEFSQPVSVQLVGPGISKGDRTIQFTTATTAATVPAHVSGHRLTLSLGHDPDLAVLTPGAVATTGAAPAPVLSPIASRGDNDSGTAPRVVAGLAILLVLALGAGALTRLQRR